MTGDLPLRLLAGLLPRPARDRYLEEWRADARAAVQAGLRRRDVVRGAAMLTLRIDRDLPAHTNEPRGAVPRRLARRGSALGAAAAVVLAGWWLTGGGIVPEGPGAWVPLVAALRALSRITPWLALAAVVIGMGYVGCAAFVARTALAKASLLAAVAGPVTLVAVLALDLHGGVSVLGVVLTLFGLVGGLAVVIGSSPLSLEPRTASLAQRLPFAGAGLGGVIVVIVLGAIDTLVWNPLAKVPGLELGAIYARMAKDDGFVPWSAVLAVSLWAAFWGGLAVTVAVLASRHDAAWMTPRRVSMLLLGVLGGSVFFRFFAGFGIGMSIADTFATNGGDVSIVSALLAHLGPLALAAAAVLFGWAPRLAPPERRRPESPGAAAA